MNNPIIYRKITIVLMVFECFYNGQCCKWLRHLYLLSPVSRPEIKGMQNTGKVKTWFCSVFLSHIYFSKIQQTRYPLIFF